LTFTLSDDFKYAIINGYYGTIVHLVIPAEISGFPVQMILFDSFGDLPYLESISLPASLRLLTNAFGYCPRLTSITVDPASEYFETDGKALYSKGKETLYFYGAGLTDSSYTLPDTLMTIEARAFKNCTALKNITLPNALLNIENGAFYGCAGLTSLTLPAAVAYIVNGAFGNCSSLKSFAVDPANTHFETDGKALYNKGKTELLQYAIGLSDATYALPDTLTEIGGGAFESCVALTSITLPNSATTINGSAFMNCTELTSFFFASSSKLAEIGGQAFSGCTALQNFTLPGTVTYIGGSAFENCKALTDITLPASLATVYDQVFEGCTGLASIALPATLTKINKRAFYGCTALKSITLPAAVTSIGSSAFGNCASLKSFAVDAANADYVTDGKALYNKGKTEILCYAAGLPDSSYVLPNTLTKIDSGAFAYCVGLTSITFPASFTSFEIGAFEGCTSLTAFVVDAANQTYETDGTMLYNKGKTELLLYAPGLKDSSYTLPASTARIANGAFYACTVLTNLSFASGSTLHYIGWYAFQNCTGLASVALPTSLTWVESYAFENCTSLAKITFAGSKEDWAKITLGKYWNKNCPLLKVVTCTDGTVTISD
jgi:hypothetical protein